MKADPKTETAVMSIMNQFAEAFGKRDVVASLALLAPDPDVVFIGTGGDEKRIGLADIKALFQRDFAQFEDASLKLVRPSVSAAGSVAWMVADLILRAKTGGREISLQARSTAVLEERRDRWLIVQLHASLPAAGQKGGEAFPTY
jgi:ketosteroid isomerase-like protein